MKFQLDKKTIVQVSRTGLFYFKKIFYFHFTNICYVTCIVYVPETVKTVALPKRAFTQLKLDHQSHLKQDTETEVTRAQRHSI